MALKFRYFRSVLINNIEIWFKIRAVALTTNALTHKTNSVVGQLYSRNASQVMLIATPEASPKYDDSYMGYSVTVGDFVGHGIQGVAVGVPRGADLKGLVSFVIISASNKRLSVILLIISPSP